MAYLDAYPEGVAAEDLDDARREIDATFAGEYGVLRPDACRVAVVDGVAVGAILVVERSIWDPELAGPFIIDLFVAPASTGRGFGAALIVSAIEACSRAGDARLSLRIGEGTSDAASHLYSRLGFEPLAST